MSTRTILCLALGVLLPMLGCNGGEKHPTVPVTGTVTYKGAPVDGATVSFISKEKDARGASGSTDAQGQFKLSTYFGGSSTVAGALPGDYAVTVRKRENTTELYRANMAGGANPEAGKMLDEAAKGKDPPPPSGGGPPGRGAPSADMMRGRGIEGKSLIPEKYESVVTSGLTATVKPSGSDPVKLELVD